DEPEISQKISYQQLHNSVAKLANGLKKLGVKKGDRVCIYMEENNNTKFANSEPQKPRWNVGLELSYPLGNTAADSNISNAEIQLQRLEQQKYEQKLQLQTKSATLRVQIDLLAKTLASNSKQIAIAKARTVEEKKRYSNGNGQASFVINAQNNEQNVQLNYAQVAKNYQNAYLEYQAAADVLYP
ncbi:MAG: TolC family protein, partial [Candidatus Thioglobus sp.]|nr:TolC family protein [Candidatus Thioglobus sp.]